MAEAQRVDVDPPTDTATRPRRSGGLFPEPITGKVAQLLSERELVINRGRQDGVTAGTIFAVLADKPLEVRDPDSDEVLATIDQEKVRVKVTRVLDRAAVCKTFELRVVAGSPLHSLLTIVEESPFDPERRVPVTLAVEKSALPSQLPQQDRVVRPGDPVIERLEIEE